MPLAAVQSNSLSQRQALSYAAPTMAMFFLYGPIFMLQGIYSKYFGMALTTIATVIFLANVFDALTDPIVGYFSDRYYSHTGSRKAFLVGGGALCLIASYFLYVPPDNVTAWFFLGCYIAYYLSLKIFDIPHLAWPSALTGRSRMRNKLYGLRSFMIFFGTLLFYSVPQLPFFETTEFTPLTLKFSVMVSAVLLVPTLYICVKWVPNGRTALVLENKTENQPIVGSLIKIICSNKPLLIFLVAVLLSGSALGMWAALSFIYIDAYLNLGEQFSLIYVISLIFSMLALRVWYKVANYFGNIGAWGAGVFLIIVGISCMGMLTPDETGFIPLILVMIVIYIGVASNNIMTPSLLSNIVDYGTWKFGADHAGLYFSILTMTTKINLAIANAVALGVAGWYGFQPSLDIHTPESIFGLRVSISWIPVCIGGLSLVLIWASPINVRRHNIIRRRLETRERRYPKKGY